MPTLTIRNVPNDLLKRLKTAAARNRRSMEQEVRELLRQRYCRRREVLDEIRQSWMQLPTSSAAEIDRWIARGRS